MGPIMSPHRGTERSYSRLPAQTIRYLDAIIETCAHASPASIVLFGSAASGGASSVSDVDLIVVLPDDATPDTTQRLRDEIAHLEVTFGFRPSPFAGSRGWRSRVERAAGHLFPCCVCTRRQLLSGDVAAVLGLRRWEAPFVDRIILASIVASAVTIAGEDLVPRIAVPPIRHADVFKALFSFVCQIVLSIAVFPVLSDATKFAMGALKHSVRCCYFCYHRRSAPLNEEIAFFNRRFGASRTLMALLALRRQYRPSFWFIIRCLPTVVSLQVRTARDFGRP
jgi:predicted nucleotidyltransferase